MKTVWVVQYVVPYEESGARGVFTTAAAGIKALDKATPFDRRTWPRAKAWKQSKWGGFTRKDGWEVVPYELGVLQ